MEAFFASGFTSNIMASQKISKFFKVYKLWNEKSCILVEKGSLSMNDIIWEPECENGLYPVRYNSDNTLELTTSSYNQTRSYEQWHHVVGHIYLQRYLNLSKKSQRCSTISTLYHT